MPVTRPAAIWPLSENDRSSSSQLLNHPADQVMRSPAAVPENRTPTMCDSKKVDAVVIVDSSMKSMSRAFAIISRPTPSFCLPSVTHARAPIGMERFRSVDVQVRETVVSRPR